MTSVKLTYEDGRWFVSYTHKNGGARKIEAKESALAGDLQNWKGPGERLVELTRDANGGITSVRPEGSAVEASGPESERQQQRPDGPPPGGQGACFHNPYNFCPAMPRESVNGDLADHPPASHDIYDHSLWTGRIRVKMTVKTPVIIPDAARVSINANKHPTYDIRIGPDGLPLIPPTSVKGMLRSAYETVTNSRMGVLEQHKERLALRPLPTDCNDWVPVRIVNGSKGLEAQEMLAACVPFPCNYWKKIGGKVQRETESRDYLKGKNHLAHVWAEVREVGAGVRRHWEVVTPIVSFNGKKPASRSGSRVVEGYVFKSNKNIDNKHYERVFFAKTGGKTWTLNDTHTKAWKDLIKDYRDANEQDIKRGSTHPPALRPACSYSKHILDWSSCRELTADAMCYAEVQRGQVVALYPVAISRKLWKKVPNDLLDESLKPAPELNKLSPADRVFGWVKDESRYDRNTGDADRRRAYRGNLRIGKVKCCNKTADDVLESFSEAVPLAILSKPKPQQVRFYVSKDQSAVAQENGIAKQEAGYDSISKGLRGRKVYPHHKWTSSKQNYWNPKADNVRSKEYLWESCGDNQPDEQNRSVTRWIKPGSQFSFDVAVTNLSDLELGALLWLLSLPKDYCHRLGYGKPLGFGSVHLEIDWNETGLCKGDKMAEFYKSLELEAAPAKASQEELINEETCPVKSFKDAVASAYGNGHGFDNVNFIAAYKRCAKGFDDDFPIHYPRMTRDRSGEIFKWFVENEASREHNPGRKLSLPNLWQDRGLPYNPTR